jgi:hypothetical protein
MRLPLYSIGQYTDSKVYYIQRLIGVDDFGTVSYKVIVEGIETKRDANLILRKANSIGLRPLVNTCLELNRYFDELKQAKTKPLTPFFVNLPKEVSK